MSSEKLLFETEKEMKENEIRFVVNRPTHSEDDLRKRSGIPKDGEERTFGYKIKTAMRRRCSQCSLESVRQFFSRLFPVFHWIKHYHKGWIVGDIVCGITIGVVHIPQSLAFSILAGLAPVFGLYTSFYPVLIYLLMGTSRHISVGTFAVTSLLTRSVVQRLVPDELADNSTMSLDATAIPSLNDTSGALSDFDMRRAGVAASLTFVMGMFQIIFGIFRLGFITSYLSESVIQGFTTGSACQVVTSQVPSILGIKITPFNGPVALVYSWIEIGKGLPRTHIATLIVTILCIIFLVIGRTINLRYKAKMKIAFPTEVILVIITILASYFGKFEERYDVNVVGYIPLGLPPPRVPDMSIIGSLVTDGFVLAIVGFTVSVSLSKMYGCRHGYSIDPNQELLAYGASNFVPAFFMCFPNAAALARCEIQDNTGGHTQLVEIISVIIVVIVVLVLGPIFEPLPRPVLGCIIIVGLFGIISQLLNLKLIFKQSKVDFVVWITTFLAVVILGVDLGLLVGMVFSILTVIARTQVPTFEILANIPDTDIYRKKGKYAETKSTGMLIVKLHASLYYVNKDLFMDKLIAALGFDPGHTLSVMKKEREIREHAARLQSKGGSGCCTLHKKNDSRDERVESTSNGNGRQSTGAQISLELEPVGRENAVLDFKSDIHTVIVDCGSFGFIDIVGAKILKQFCKQLNDLGIVFLLANCSGDVRKSLERIGYFEVSGPDGDFISIHDAALFANHKRE